MTGLGIGIDMTGALHDRGHDLTWVDLTGAEITGTVGPMWNPALRRICAVAVEGAGRMSTEGGKPICIRVK